MLHVPSGYARQAPGRLIDGAAVDPETKDTARLRRHRHCQVEVGKVFVSFLSTITYRLRKSDDVSPTGILQSAGHRTV